MRTRLAGLLLLGGMIILASACLEDDLASATDEPTTEAEAEAGAPSANPTDNPVTSLIEAPTTTETRRSPLDPNNNQWVDPASSGRPWSDNGAVDGLLTFRGNPTRTYYGQGPVPDNPRIAWSATIGCSQSAVGEVNKTWCGSGWTGQPAVFRAPEVHGGAWWVAVGGYNRAVNFYDPGSGDEAFPPFFTNDIIKGSVTVDPDGYPLLYTGSRDSFYHIVALDRDEPEELWQLSAVDDEPTLWNNDWDSSGLVIDDYLFVGGENSRFYVVKLNRDFDPGSGLVTVDPQVVVSEAGWDSELIAEVGSEVSIEGSVAISGDVVYFSNSGGLVQGWDISDLTEGQPPERVFRFWTGDDTDASVVIDDEGMLYVVSEFERNNQRSRDLGQVFKLDPSRPEDPVVWSREANNGVDTGVWATPALYKSLVIVATDDGRILGLDRETGDEVWVISRVGSLWSSPVVVDDVLIQGGCDGLVVAYQLDDRAEPGPLWEVEIGSCVESTPAVWDGWIWVGARDGSFYALADPGASFP